MQYVTRTWWGGMGVVSSALLFAYLTVPQPVDAITITNTVESSSYTGGNVVRNGADGADGEDGRDGADGGTNGHSSVHIQTIVNGEVVTDIHRTSADGAVSATETYRSPDVHDQQVMVYTSAEADTSLIPPSADLFGILTSIRLMLITYATHLI